jgi:hypothetical protein
VYVEASCLGNSAGEGLALDPWCAGNYCWRTPRFPVFDRGSEGNIGFLIWRAPFLWSCVTACQGFSDCASQSPIQRDPKAGRV